MSEPYNDLKQVEMSIEAAQKMVGSATMSMEPGQLASAAEAVNQAKLRLNEAQAAKTGVDEQFLKSAQKTLFECENQLNEAQQ